MFCVSISRDGEIDGVSCLADANGNLNVLNVERNSNGSFVNSNYANPDNVWNGNEQLLVCRKCYCFSPLRWGVFFSVYTPNRLKAYISYYFSNTWENNRSEQFPILLFICPATNILIYAKWTAKKLLAENQSPSDLYFRFTIESELRQKGVGSEIWEPLK